jgi:hypothetical protein
MTKYQWFYADWIIPMSTIRSMMLSYQFTEEGGEGFLLSRSGKTFIEGKFIRKNEYLIFQEMPLGGQEEIQKIDYSIASFRVSCDKKIGLEIIDPPRTIRPFISKMSEMIGLGMVVSEYSIDPLLWVKEIEKRSDKVLVTEMQGSGVRISNSSIAKFLVRGELDVREDWESFIQGKKYSLNGIKIKIKKQDVREESFIVELKGSGSARFFNDNHAVVYEIVRDGFVSLKNNRLQN